jgi:adenylate cyclase
VADLFPLVGRAAAAKVAERMKSSIAFSKQYVGPAVLCLTLAWVLSLTEWMREVENITLDLRTKFRVRYQAPADPRLIVLGVDDDGVERYGRWPWPRQLHGQMMTLLNHAGAAVVTWDILFTEPDETNPTNDALLLKGTQVAMAGRTEVVFAANSTEPSENPRPESAKPLTRPLTAVEGDIKRLLGDEMMEGPFESLAESGRFAFVDAPPDAAGMRRTVPLVVRVGQRVYPSLSLETLIRFWNVSETGIRVRLGDAIYLKTAEGEKRIPIDAQGRYFINYRLGEEQANFQSYGQILLNLTHIFVDEKPEKQEVDLKGRIVLVGQHATALTDNGPTPFHGKTPLVLVHANVIDNVLRGDFAQRAPVIWVWLAGLAISVAGLWWLRDRTLGVRAVWGLGIPLVYAAMALRAWTSFSLWMPIVWPLLGYAALQVYEIVRRLIAEQRQKEKIKGMFGTYLSPMIVNRMAESGEMPRLGGHQEDITAYFSDIQGFSTFSEKLPPDRLVELMNEYLTACTDIVQEEGGTLDKYIGDAVIAMFGAPIVLPDHAYRACVATLRTQKKLGELREKWRLEGDKWPEIVWRMQSRIGLNSGRCIIGNMGSRSRFNYTMMGDNVNLAARMESGAKSWGVYLMCTGATKAACEQHGGDRVVFRSLGNIMVMGRSHAVPCYEIVGLKEDVTAQTREGLALFEAALVKYLARDWAGALELLARSEPLESHGPGRSEGGLSNPSLIYIEIVRRCQAQVLPEDWDGTQVMKEK